MNLEDDPTTPTFSTIKFFSGFERKLKTIRTFPLTSANLVVQQDAYQRLASSEGDRPMEFFAELEYGHKTKDSDVRFSVQFASRMFVLNIEGISTSGFVYTDCFKDEEDAVKQIVTVLKMLAAGQLAVLLTERHNEICAAELLLYQKDSSIPTVLVTEARYSRRWRKNDESDYETVLLRNTRLHDRLAVPANFFIADRDSQGVVMSKGRVFATPELTPLTKRLFYEMAEETIMRESGKRPDESEAMLLMRSPEYWLLVVLIFVVLYGGIGLGLIPRWFGDHPIVLIPLLIILSAFVLFPILGRKEYLKQHHPTHWWVRADAVFQRYVVAAIQSIFRRRKKPKK